MTSNRPFNYRSRKSSTSQSRQDLISKLCQWWANDGYDEQQAEKGFSQFTLRDVFMVWARRYAILIMMGVLYLALVSIYTGVITFPKAAIPLILVPFLFALLKGLLQRKKNHD